MDDILLAENNELLFADGKLVRGESTLQHQRLILITSRGDWRFSPLVGVGAFSFLKDEDNARLFGDIKQQFELDGMKVSEVKFVNDNIQVEASYKNA